LPATDINITLNNTKTRNTYGVLQKADCCQFKYIYKVLVGNCCQQVKFLMLNRTGQ